MENNYNKVAKVADEGYELDFGFIFEKTFDNFKKIWGIAGVALLIVSIALIALIFGLFGIIYGFSNYAETLVGLNPEFMTSTALRVYCIFNSICRYI